MLVSIFSHKSSENVFGYIQNGKNRENYQIWKLFGKKKYVVLYHIAKINKRSLSNKSIALGKLLKI